MAEAGEHGGLVHLEIFDQSLGAGWGLAVWGKKGV